MRTVLEPRRPLPDAGTVEAPTIDYLNIRDYLRILSRRRWVILPIVAAGVLGAVLYNRMATPMFESRATLQIEADTNTLALDRPLVDQRDWMREYLPTQLGILTSRELARLTHEQLKRIAEADGRETPVPTVGDIARGRTVDPVKDTRIVNVGFRSTDPEMAASVANTLARAYVKRNLELRSNMTGEASDWLAQQVTEQRKLVEASEAALQRYRKQHGADALVTDRQGGESQNFVVQKLVELQGAVSRARADTIDKEAQYKQLTALQANREPVDTLPAIASNLYLQSLKNELTTLQRQLVQASKELGERHPEIIKLQGAVQNADRKLQTEIANAVRSIQNDYEAAKAREDSLTSALERQKGEVRALNAKAVDYTALEREAVSSREVLDKLLQRSREASLTRELQTTNVRIIDPAAVPTEPFSPRRERNVLLAVVGSGTLSLAVVFLLEIFNTRVTSPDDVKRHLGIPLLGVAPRAKPQKGHSSLILGHGAPPQFAELLHAVRTNLIMAPELATGHTLLVTSSEPGEGKTLTAANLATSLAALNQRVLLIDADLRKPRLHEVFGEQQQPGLTDVLTGYALYEIAQAMGTSVDMSNSITAKAFRKTKIPRLWLLPSGCPSRNPADLLGSERFSKLIEMFRDQFDWVVLDSPPVLAVTDPCLIARTASGVLFVVRSGQTSRQVASAAVEQLDAVGANVVGAMLNRVVLDQRGESYLPYYHKSYQTYYPSNEDSTWVPELPGVGSKSDAAGTTAEPVAHG